jgi:hypothetical protein
MQIKAKRVTVVLVHAMMAMGGGGDRYFTPIIINNEKRIGQVIRKCM